jgi:HK97 family phage portal protein
MIMDILSSMMPARRAIDFGPLSDFWYNPVGTTSSSGIVVKPNNAMGVSAVFACIRILSEVMGSLDIRLMQRNAKAEATEADDHDFYKPLLYAPNRWQTPLEWQEMGMAHLCLRGNFYCRIVWSSDLDQYEFLPMNPDRLKVEFAEPDAIRYSYTPKVGVTYRIPNDQILHVRGLTIDGVTGVSVLEYARNTVGSAIAQETHGASLFRNGALPAFWISRPMEKRWTSEAASTFRTQWRTLHGGADNSGNPPILLDGMEIHELGLTNKDSQWLEARQFQAKEICRFFRVPPHMIGAEDAAPSSTVEQMSLEFVLYTLAPWAVRWQQSLNRDLQLRDEYYTQISLSDLLKADTNTQYTTNNIAVQGGVLTVNEARARIGYGPIEGGDELRAPLNMQPAGGGPDWNEQGGQPGKGTPKPTDQKKPDPEDTEPAPPPPKKKKKAEAFAAYQPLFVDAASRISAHEITGLSARAEKAEKDRKKWNAWASEFYLKHRDYVGKVTQPLQQSWHNATGNGATTEAIVEALDAAIAPVFDFANDIPSLLRGWSESREAEILGILTALFTKDDE